MKLVPNGHRHRARGTVIGLALLVGGTSLGCGQSQLEAFDQVDEERRALEAQNDALRRKTSALEARVRQLQGRPCGSAMGQEGSKAAVLEPVGGLEASLGERGSAKAQAVGSKAAKEAAWVPNAVQPAGLAPAVAPTAPTVPTVLPSITSPVAAAPLPSLPPSPPATSAGGGSAPQPKTVVAVGDASSAPVVPTAPPKPAVVVPVAVAPVAAAPVGEPLGCAVTEAILQGRCVAKSACPAGVTEDLKRCAPVPACPDGQRYVHHRRACVARGSECRPGMTWVPSKGRCAVGGAECGAGMTWLPRQERCAVRGAECNAGLVWVAASGRCVVRERACHGQKGMVWDDGLRRCVPQLPIERNGAFFKKTH